MDVRAPFMPYDKLREVARDFLNRHHAAGYLPIPIEEIIELDFMLDIVPMPNLKEQFDVDAFITNDLSEIRVDEFIWQHRPTRYRFSLAHELAHLLIHRDVFDALKFGSIREWKQVMCSIPEKEYAFIENQAYSLAGLMLVPPAPLSEMLRDHYATARRAGVDPDDLGRDERRTIASSIGRLFEVSAEVVERRLVKDKLWT